MGIKQLCTSTAQTLAVGRELRGFTSTNIENWTRERVNKVELWRAGRVFFPLERAVVMVLLTVEEESVFLLHTLTEGSGMPLSNRTTPANGSKIDQVMPLLDSVKVKTNKRGRLRKPLKVLAADKGYDSKDKRAALRRGGIRPQWPKLVWKTKKNKGRPIKISVPCDNKKVVSHGFKKNIVVLFVVTWERISACFDAFLSLATIYIWINKTILVGYIHLWAFAQHYFFWACHALVLKLDEIMTTEPSRLTSSTGSSCFLTSGIAVQVPLFF
ncbi:hypothetical protein RintRC_0735 [Richelia intracellularis]|nr:hypothetical protein RintRC_0735 [Richelia intracellularis]